MNKTVIFTLSFLPLLALATDQNQTSLKGSDLISTDVGAIYTYVITDSKDSSKTVNDYQLIVKSCNKDKTECMYQTKPFSNDESYSGETEMMYEIKDGAVYSRTLQYMGTDNKLHQVSEKPELILPKEIILNKSKEIKSSNDMYEVEGAVVYTKLLPEITINGNTYKDCVRSESKSLQRNKKLFSDSNENYFEGYGIDCKGVGSVLTTFSNSNPKTGKYYQKDVMISLSKISKV